jgi:hypothetical protein
MTGSIEIFMKEFAMTPNRTYRLYPAALLLSGLLLTVNLRAQIGGGSIIGCICLPV